MLSTDLCDSTEDVNVVLGALLHRVNGWAQGADRGQRAVQAVAVQLPLLLLLLVHALGLLAKKGFLLPLQRLQL